MSRRILVGVALLWAVPAMVSAASQQARRDRPNIVLIVGDDMGYHDIGLHGSTDIPTPHIDSIARTGVRCTSGYVSGPYCSPTRAGLLTGRYQQRFGHEFNPGPPGPRTEQVGLSLDEQTLPQKLRTAGYATGMVGKWHLGHAAAFHPTARGFQEFYGFLGGAHPYLPGRDPVNNRVMRGSTPVDETEYLTDAFKREATSFIDRHKSDPFFLYLAFNAVHTPMHTVDRYRSRFPGITDPKRQTYAAMMSAMDDAVGDVLARLKANGLDDNTLVCFISDNGGPLAVNGSDNTPLNGRKATTWEGGIRVPFMARWPGKIPAGRTFDRPVIQLDLHTTALAAAGVKTDAGPKLDGVDLLPYFSGRREGDPHEALFWRFGEQTAIRVGDWKLVRAAGARRGMAAVSPAMLFDLKSDIGEKTDLAGAQPERVKSMQAVWERWNAELKAPTWGPARARAAADNDD